MAWTNWGFDGTINEAQWAQMAGLLGNDYVAAGNGDCLVTSIAGTRSVSVAAGTLYGDGVVSVNSGAETVAMTTPVNGQWYVIALRRTWATNTAALVAIAGATTTTTTPTAAPSSFPTLNTNVGVLTDQPIAWAWCNSANTTQVIFDIRKRAVKSMPAVVATAAERDAKYMSPTQGLQVWRDDLGAVETYYGLYNASTNPGGRDAAGWYANDRQTGLVMLKATTLTAITGTATVSAIGKITFTGISGLQLDGIFSSKYKNYKLIYTGSKTAIGDADIYLRVASAGSVVTSNYQGGWSQFGLGETSLQARSNTTYVPITGQYYQDQKSAEITISNPFLSTWTEFYGVSTGVTNVKHTIGLGGGYNYNSTSYDGLYLGSSASTLSGSLEIFGFND